MSEQNPEGHEPQRHEPEPDEPAAERREPSSDAASGAGAPASGDGAKPQPLSLDLGDKTVARKRGRSGLVAVLLVAAAVGGIVGLIFGRLPGLIVAAAVGLPLLYVVWAQLRRTVWLDGSVVGARSGGVRHVDLTTANRIELMVTSVRGVRSIGLLIGGPPSGKTLTVTLAVYSGTGGRELGILELRKLADTLVNNTEASGMVFSELLVAQLRAEARGDGAADRPLYRVASLAPEGKVTQRLKMDAVSRFVANLD